MLGEKGQVGKTDRELTFDEFSAIRARDKASEKPASRKPATSIGSNDRSQGVGNAKRVDSKQRYNIVDVFELNEMQAFYVGLLLLDTACVFLSVGIDAEMANELNTFDVSTIGTISLISSFSKTLHTFAMIFFLLELGVMVISHRLRVFGHFGYIIDSIILAIQWQFGSEGLGRLSIMLNFARVWRLYRLFSTIVDTERDLHSVTKQRLDELEIELQSVKTNFSNVEEDLDKERDARLAVEDMLQNYKEEVDTLNEALQIAARDIAEVAEADDDLLSSDDEEEDEFADTLSKSTKESSVKSAQRKERDTLFEHARKSGANPPSSQPTFTIGADGSFRKL